MTDVKWYFNLSDLLLQINKSELVFACDINSDGAKKFCSFHSFMN